jgi:peroxiredoxin
MHKAVHRRAASTFGAVLFLTIASTALADDTTTLTKVGDAVPQFTVRAVDGQIFTPESLKGKVVLLNFFATWCGPCNAEMPHLQKLHERFKDKPFVLMSVGREHKIDEVKKFAGEKNLTFTFAADPKRDAFKLFATESIPRSYVIDPSGKIVFQSVGFDEKELQQMADAIEKALPAAPTK